MNQRTSSHLQGTTSLSIQADNLIQTGLMLQYRNTDLVEFNNEKPELGLIAGLLILFGVIIKLAFEPVDLAHNIYNHIVSDVQVPYSYQELSQMEVMVQPVRRESCKEYTL